MSEEDTIKTIIQNARKQIQLENRALIFEEGKPLRGNDLKTPQDPEAFTKQQIIEKIFQLLNIQFKASERWFATPTGRRKVDYSVETGNTRFLVEAKPLNTDLRDKKREGAVNQIKGLFLLDEVKRRYDFGIATNGLTWIFINPEQEEIAELSLEKDYKEIKRLITGAREAGKERKQEEISKRFFQWYNALLHGGIFKDQENKIRKITETECLVNNIHNTESKEDAEEIAQTIIDRLIFIKFLQTKGLIKRDILDYLAKQPQEDLNWKLNNLFFNTLNTEKKKRRDIDPAFQDIPYLNGSLFSKTKVELNNPEYTVQAEILAKIIEFLDSFRFTSEDEETQDALDPEILGYIFERAMTATDRKGTGAYYTPKYITRYISENTIYPAILTKAQHYLKNEKGYKDTELPQTFDELIEKVSSTSLSEIYANIVQKLKVLDPACGSGAFLLAAANTLLQIYRKFEERIGLKNTTLALKKIILKNNIYGVDINHKGIEIAKLRLWLWIAESYTPESKIEPLPNIEYNIRPGNSLIGYTDLTRFKETKITLDDYTETEETLQHLLNTRDRQIKEYKTAYGDNAKKLKKEIENLNTKIKRKLDIRLFQEINSKIPITTTEFIKLEPFHWGFEFHEVFSNGEDNTGFDVVIGNPPYVRQEQLKEIKPLLKEYYETYTSIADLYVYFYERGHKILRGGGQFGFISSNKFIRSNYGKSLRKFLSRFYLRKIIDFGELPVFEDATTYPMIILTENSAKNKEQLIYVAVNSLDFTDLDAVVRSRGVKVPNSSIQRENWVLENKKVLSILEKIGACGTTLNDYTAGNIKFGVKTGFNKAYIIDEPTKDKLIREHPESDEIIKPLIVGNDVRKYEINFNNKYLIWCYIGVELDRYPAIKRHLENFKSILEKRSDQGNEWFELRPCEYYSDFDRPKIVYPDLSQTPRFCIDRDGFFIEATLFEIPLDDPYLLSILNSKLCAFFVKTHTPIFQGATFRFKTIYLKQLPIRSISFTTPEEERNRLVNELKDLYSKGDFDRILELVESYLPKDSDGNFITEQEKSDVVHDLLAFLAEQMIEMNKEKQKEIKGFLNWLEGYTKVKVDDLTLKSKLKEYYNLKWNEMQKILEKNKGKITEVDITRREPQEKIKEEFNSSIGKLKPLLDRIKDTDWLIDQVVYKLYGLTDQEIEIVEGKATENK